MEFDFKTFERLVAGVHSGGPYSLKEELRVFWLYFEQYERNCGYPHPPIRTEQIRRILSVMPYLDPEDFGAYYRTVEPDDYPSIIVRHFKTRYRNCDFNINHFFSGIIRKLRFYESC